VPPQSPRLQSGEIHLWRFRLDLPATQVNNLIPLLSADERARADRLLNRTKSQSFVIARARLRQILSRYLASPAAELRFIYGPTGKPHVDPCSSPFYFNLSHANIWAMLAVSGEGELGVDVEYIDPELDFFAIARRFYSPGDLAELISLPAARQRRCFYQRWTTREAICKARGTGIFNNSADPAHGLQVLSLSLNPDFVGALAYGFNLSHLHCWNLGSDHSG
jgi:4'-phosphopantetheinyl transferase